jgi:copper ion binding protein
MKRTISIEGMMCGHCTGRVEKTLSELDNVTVVEVSVDAKHAVVEVNNVSDDLLKESIEDIGYDVLAIN